VSNTTMRTLGASGVAAGNRVSSCRSRQALRQWINTNATSSSVTSTGVVRLQNFVSPHSFRFAQRVKTVANPTASRKQLQCRSRPMHVSQSYAVRNDRQNVVVANKRIFGKIFATIAMRATTSAKSTRSTSGEIQTMGAETCSMAPQFRQFSRWKTMRRQPSIRPAKIPNQITAASKVQSLEKLLDSDTLRTCGTAARHSV
jgi:hypothetical protein